MESTERTRRARSRSKLTKRVVDQTDPDGKRQWLWDSDLRGFGVQIEKSGTKTYIVRYRIKGEGRNGGRRFVKIGRHGDLTTEEARLAAKAILGRVATGEDPAAEREQRKQNAAARDQTPTFAEVAQRFLLEHAAVRCKPSTAANYEILLRVHAIPLIGRCKIDSLTKSDVQKFHTKLSTKPLTANRVLTVISCVYGYAARFGIIPDQLNPARGIDKFREEPRERYLTSAELQRLGQALTEAETTGIPWNTNLANPQSKHLPKNVANHTHVMDRYAVAAIRLLLFTGARLREILHTRWEYIDAGRCLIFLPDSKTGRKTIVLNSAALDVIETLRPDAITNDRHDQIGYVIRGQLDGSARSDLKKPWSAIQRRAGLEDVRLHDLRHTFASVGAGASLGLPIVGRLLGHTQPQTTARYAHLDISPARIASETIGKKIVKSMQ